MCNYILIPLALCASCLFLVSPHSLFASYRPRLIRFRAHLLVIVINLCIPSRCFSHYVRHLRADPEPYARASGGKVRYVYFAQRCQSTVLSPFPLPFGDIVTYPRLVTLLCLAFPVARSFSRIELRLRVNKKARAPPSPAGIRFASSLFRRPAPLVAASASVLNYWVVTILRG